MNTEGLSNACKAKNNDSQTGSTGLIQTHVTSAMGPSVREWGDASVRDEEKDGQFQEAASDLTTFKLVRDALKRIEEGTFGKCVVDSGPIEEKRLHAVPWTPYWLKHEQLLEKEHPRRMPTL